ncbi:MAG: DNA primase, partial [Rhodospirillales bacterium]|nr:DNA primase [Rhodospirillales bacterium]
MAFPPAFLDEIRERMTVSSVIGRRVRLVRAGREFKGLCPFHNEKTPSFTVNDDKGFFHCFGCG